MVKRLLLGLSLVFAMATLGFCQAAPSSTKGDGDLTIDAKHQKDIDGDIAMGKKYVEQVEKTEKISKNEEMQKRVQRIGGTMAELANKTHIIALWGDKRYSKFDYDFKVLEGKDVNAFSLPGGHIYVYEGLLKFVQSDDELAAVLGHEITHAALRHVAQLQHDAAKNQAIEIPLILAAIFRGGDAGYGVLSGVQLTSQAVMSGWSVKAEDAADYGGFQLMQKSPYNMSACLTLVERLNTMEKNNPQLSQDWGIFRTHPPSDERVSAIFHDLKEANITIHRSAVTTSFAAQLKKVDGGVQAWFNNKLIYTFTGDDADQRAEVSRKRLNEFFDSMPALTDVSNNGDQILGKAGVLIDVQPEDADKAKVSVPELVDKTKTSIKGAVFGLALQTWQPGAE